MRAGSCGASREAHNLREAVVALETSRSRGFSGLLPSGSLPNEEESRLTNPKIEIMNTVSRAAQ